MAGLPMCQLLGDQPVSHCHTLTVSHSHLPQNLNKHSHPIFLDSSIGISQLSKYDCREERERERGGGGEGWEGWEEGRGKGGEGKTKETRTQTERERGGGGRKERQTEEERERVKYPSLSTTLVDNEQEKWSLLVIT